LKSINRFIYGETEEVGLNVIFGTDDAGFKYELLGMLAFILIWLAVSFILSVTPGFENFQGFAPVPVFKALWAAVFENRFWVSVLASLKRIGIGIFIAALIGIPSGLVIGFFPRLRKLTYSPVQFLRMISPLSWMPVAVIVFADFDSAVDFLIVMATVWPIILNTAMGVTNINPQWIKMALNQGADNAQLMRTIIIPFSMPYFLTSIRMALGIAWIVLVPAEFLGVSSGLGYLINDARDTMEYDRLMAMIIAIGILGFILDRILQKIQTVYKNSWTE